MSCLMIQATAEQIRLAQVIYDKNDSDFECKVNQVRMQEFPSKFQCMKIIVLLFRSLRPFSCGNVHLSARRHSSRPCSS